MAITEGGNEDRGYSTGGLAAQERAQSSGIVQPDQIVLTQKQSEAMNKLKALGAELRRFVSVGRRAHKDEHNSIGL